MTYTRESPVTGQGTATAEQIDRWFREVRGPVGASFLKTEYVEPPEGIGAAIIEFSQRWGINSDIAAGLMDHECAGWQSRISREKQNPGGYGAENDAPFEKAIDFDTPRDGIRAVVAHLATYARGLGNWVEHSPRAQIVIDRGWAGVVKQLSDLEQRWAWSPEDRYEATPIEERYGAKIAIRTMSLYEFAKGSEMSAQIEGFGWVPADSDHFTAGRSEEIRGGAQHYSAGTNSLGWLTTDSPGSNPQGGPVSAHFLIKHNPTMADRGWQLVRMQDTAWTTSKANPYTVSTEYEHTGGPVSEQAYQVLAQTWVDIAKYVKDHDLGEVPLSRHGIKGHKKWVGNSNLTCPDGIDIERLVLTIRERQGKPDVAPPRITETVPDPWREDNPWSSGYWIPKEFVGYIEDRGFMDVGYVVSEAFDEGELIVQYFERARLEMHPEQAVMAGHVGIEAMLSRYPERRR